MPTNNDPFAPWNDPWYKDDPRAPHNNPMDRDDPRKPWNNPFGSKDQLSDEEKRGYNIPVRRRYEEDNDY